MVFLLYMNRSGSTLLAHLLDQYRDIGVTPEADIPDGLLLSTADIREEIDILSYLDKLYRNRKFSAWNVDRDRLERALRGMIPPYGFEHILLEILSLYFSSSHARVYIYKRGHYINHVPELRRLFPGCRFLFIERDPRAIFESQKRSVDSVSGRVMAVNAVERAIKYVRTMKLVERYSSDGDFFSLRFEDLVSDPDRAICPVLDFLGVDNRETVRSRYFQKIPESQHHLHRGILAKPALKKIDEWQKVLRHEEIDAMQWIAGRTIRSRGYELFPTSTGCLRSGFFLLWAVGHLLFRHAPAEVLRRTIKR
ncbi:sulfotransferase family protein [Desulfofustis glycolicus]|nr:sulfotransferase [Desulfofustis glycolicus]